MTPVNYLLGQEMEICYNGVSIPCNLIQTAEVTIAQDVTEVRGLCGLQYQKKKNPTVEVQVTLLYRNLELLASIFPSYFQAGAGAADCGGIRIDATTCNPSDQVGAPLNLHPVCQTTNCNDLTLWNADPKLDFSYTFSEDDAETITITFTGLPAPATLAGGGANPHSGQIFQIGAPGEAEGDLFNCTTMDFGA